MGKIMIGETLVVIEFDRNQYTEKNNSDKNVLRSL